MLTLTPLTCLPRLPILASLLSTQRSTRHLRLPPALLRPSPLPLPLERPSSMAGPELPHHLQPLHFLLEPASCLRPREQVCAWEGFGLRPVVLQCMSGWAEGNWLLTVSKLVICGVNWGL